jgi:hypothetical protein
MMIFTEVASVPSDPLAPFTERLRLAVAAYLARFTGSSREHTESDLRCYLAWCGEQGLDRLAAGRWPVGRWRVVSSRVVLGLARPAFVKAPRRACPGLGEHAAGVAVPAGGAGLQPSLQGKSLGAG